MVIQVEIQNKPDLLRSCRWRIPLIHDPWKHGYFHMFYQVEGGGLCVLLETESGLTFSSPAVAIELQFTDRPGECGAGSDAADLEKRKSFPQPP